MAIYYADGFEHGVVTSDGHVASQYGEVWGAVTWDSTPVYGSTSKGSLGVDGTGRFLRWDQFDIAVPSNTQQTIVVQFKLYINSLSLTNELQLLKIWTGSPFYENWIYFTSGGNIASKYWGSPPTDDSATNSFTPSTATWYTIDAMVQSTTASGTWTFDWQIGPTGGTPTTMTARTVTTSGGEIGTVVLGWIDANTGNSASFNIDDVIFSNDAADFPLADNYTIGALRPNAVGTHSIDVGSGASEYFFTNSGAITLPDTTSYQAIDDTTALLAGSDYIELRRKEASGTDTNIPPRAVDALAVTNLNESAATVRGNIDEDPDSPDGLWATATGNNVDTATRLDMPTLSVASTGTMVTKAYVRKSAPSGTGTPTCRIDLYYNGSLLEAGTDQNITSTTGEVITQNFDLATHYSSLGDGSLIELQLYGTRTGGNPSSRASVDFGAIEISSVPTITYTQPTNTWYLEYGFADNSSTDTIIGVKPVFSFVQPTSGTGDITVKLRADGVDNNIFSGNPATTAQADRAKWYSLTPNSTSWTDALLDATTLRFGFSADADPVTRLHAALLEALYQQSSGPASLTSSMDWIWAAVSTLTPTFKISSASPYVMQPATTINRGVTLNSATPLVMQPATTLTRGVTLANSLDLVMQPATDLTILRALLASLDLTMALAAGTPVRTATVQSSLDIIYGAVSTLSKTSTLSNSLDVVFDAVSTLQRGVTLQNSLDLVMAFTTASPTLKGFIQSSMDLTMGFTSATPSRTATFQTSLDLIFTPATALTRTAALQSATNEVITFDSVMTHIATLASSLGLTMTQAATLLRGVALADSLDVSWNAASDINRGVALQLSEDIVAAFSSTLGTTAGAGQMLASMNLVWDAVSTLTRIAPIVSDTQIAWAAASTLTRIKTLTSELALAMSVASTLTRGVAVQSSLDLTVGAVSTMTKTSTLAGQAALVWASQPTLTREVNLQTSLDIVWDTLIAFAGTIAPANYRTLMGAG